MDIVNELLTRLEPQANRTVPGPPKLGVAILTCMDTRIDPARMFSLAPGDAHILRNAGGVVTDDVLRSLLLSQRFLGSRAVMVVHHTRCGVLNLSDDQVKADLQAELGMRPSFALEGFNDLDADVRQSMARIRHCPILPHRDAIRGFVLDVDDGNLREVI
jgi:carbonic anhydrase